MKTISFFSEKGGVGKSSFSMMFASWLKQYEINVGLADFNMRISGYRRAEIRKIEAMIAKNVKDVKPVDTKNAWPIVEATAREILETKKNYNSTFPYLEWFKNEINPDSEGRLADCDVVVCDFPGSLTGGEFAQVNLGKMLSLIVVPIERDEMTLQSTGRLVKTLENQDNVRIFINKAQLGLRNWRSYYMKLGASLIKRNWPVLPDMVSYSERMMTMDKVDIIRSTFAFPDFNKPEYGTNKDLGIENLFIDITRELDKCTDIKGTAETDLSFVDKLVKKDDGRQLKGTAFPEYEI